MNLWNWSPVRQANHLESRLKVTAQMYKVTPIDRSISPKSSNSLFAHMYFTINSLCLYCLTIFSHAANMLAFLPSTRCCTILTNNILLKLPKKLILLIKYMSLHRFTMMCLFRIYGGTLITAVSFMCKGVLFLDLNVDIYIFNSNVVIQNDTRTN